MYTDGMPGTPEIFFSIVVPVHDRTAFIAGALTSCLNQTYSHFEVMVIDSTADDRIRGIVDGFHSPKLRYMAEMGSRELTAKLNKALQGARNPWMIVLCDDDVFHPANLAALARHIRENPAATIIKTRYRLINASGDLIAMDRNIGRRLDPYELLDLLFQPESRSFKMNMTGIAFPVALMKKIGGFRPYHRAWGSDRMAWAELGAEGGLVCDPEPLCDIRLHRGAVSGSADSDYESYVRSTLDLQGRVTEILARLRNRANSERELKLVESAQAHLTDHISRQLQLAFDQGLAGLLRQAPPGSSPQLGPALGRMRELGVAPFPSITTYRWIAKLPFALRQAALTYFENYKFDKWNRRAHLKRS